jgi:hypothetical protein
MTSARRVADVLETDPDRLRMFADHHPDLTVERVTAAFADGESVDQITEQAIRQWLEVREQDSPDS